MFISKRTAVYVIIELTNLEVLQAEVDSDLINNLPALFLIIKLFNQFFDLSLKFSIKGDVGNLGL